MEKSYIPFCVSLTFSSWKPLVTEVSAEGLRSQGVTAFGGENRCNAATCCSERDVPGSSPGTRMQARVGRLGRETAGVGRLLLPRRVSLHSCCSCGFSEQLKGMWGQRQSPSEGVQPPQSRCWIIKSCHLAAQVPRNLPLPCLDQKGFQPCSLEGCSQESALGSVLPDLQPQLCSLQSGWSESSTDWGRKRLSVSLETVWHGPTRGF